MTWYAIRTVPGAQMPQREYRVEETRSAKGYRIVPSLDPRVSAVEKALRDRGFDIYMPAEKRLVRDRRHTDLWKTRRFALMVGYVFVKDPVDFLSLSEVPGVAGIIGVNGKPMPIDLMDILSLRSMEAKAEVEFDQKSRQARQELRKKAKKDPALQKIINNLDIAGTISVPLDKGVLAA